MNSYTVRFILGGDVYELDVKAASSGSAMRLVKATHPSATSLSIAG